jgi:hypothetical protein
MWLPAAQVPAEMAGDQEILALQGKLEDLQAEFVEAHKSAEAAAAAVKCAAWGPRGGGGRQASDGLPCGVGGMRRLLMVSQHAMDVQSCFDVTASKGVLVSLVAGTCHT